MAKAIRYGLTEAAPTAGRAPRRPAVSFIKRSVQIQSRFEFI
jgi:L-serine deaminase